MSLADITALQPVLKTQYTQKKVNFLCYEDNPFLALVRKDTNFVGDVKRIALRYAAPQGRGVSIAAAQAGKTASAYGAFNITRSKDYATANITSEAILASKGNPGALIDGVTKEIDGAIHICTRSLAINMYGNGGGARGQISSASSVSSATITLTDISRITNFEKGMQIQLASDDGSSSTPAGLRNAGASATILAVDRDLGTITFTTTLSAAISAAATSDYIFQGPTTSANSDYGQMIKGLAAWLPTTAPGSTDNFFGLNRSFDATRLAGVRYDGKGGAIEETLIQAAARLGREGAKSSHVLMNPLQFANLDTALGAKVIYDRVQSVDEPEFGFETIKLRGPKGPIQILSDVNCPTGLAYMLQLDTWCLDSLKKAPRIIDDDGLMIRASANSDDWEVRVSYMAQMSCEAPGLNGVVTF